MKKLIFIPIIAIFLLTLLLSHSAKSSVSDNSYYFTCSQTLTIQSNPNSQGTYCGPSSGSFMTNANGIAVITGLCDGTYTICVNGQTLGNININEDTGSWKFQGYNIYSPQPLPPCTCGN